VLAACGDVTDVDMVGNTAQQAIARTILLSASSLTLNEGDNASVNVTQLCVDVNNQPVTIVADFNDPNDGTDITRTVSPVGLAGNVFPAGECGVGRFAVCDPVLGAANPAACNAFTHRYDDNGSVVASLGAFQAPATAIETSQTLTVTINNVAPDANLSRNVLVGAAEGTDQTEQLELVRSPLPR
jgi:hypothetical protein